MRLLDESAPWFHNMSIAEDGIVADQAERFGLGAVLIVERQRSRNLLFAKKAYRPGFEGNGQLAFPGGMVRSTGQATSLTHMTWASLVARVAAEVSLDLQAHEAIAPLEGHPPVVAAYNAKGRRRHTALLPFVLSVSKTFTPAAQDATVYDAQWQEPMNCWTDITPTNRLIAAYYLWSRLSEGERARAKPSVEDALQQATAWAKEVQLPSPVPPWSESKEKTKGGEKGAYAV